MRAFQCGWARLDRRAIGGYQLSSTVWSEL
jgi:hypothetical protein